MPSEHYAEIDQIFAKFDNPEQIAELPWIGNFAADSYLFQKIDEFEIRLAKEGRAEDLRRAAYLAQLHGMGIEQPITDAELAEYMEHLQTL